MISDELLLYLLFQLIFMVIALIGYSKIPYLGILVVIGVFSISYQTIVAFEDYWMMGIMLILSNMMISLLGILRVK
jgi:hypothetical protein